MEFKTRALNDLEDDLDASIDNLAKHDQWCVDETLPDDARLGVHFLDGIELQNEHTCQDLLFCIVVDVLWLSSYHVILKFFHKLEHQNARTLPNSEIGGEHHPHYRKHKLVRRTSRELLDTNLHISHAHLSDFVNIIR